MRKILSTVLSVVLSLSMCVGLINNTSIDVYADTSVTWPSGPGVYAETAVLIEASTGTVLYNKKANKKMYPASITKIMTALLTIENCKLDEEVVFSEAAIGSISYDDANFGCQVGEKMTVKDCLYILMLHSANEVAWALGEHVAGSIEEFGKMMTERAKQAGAKNTNFANASGLHDPNHYVTAYDMAMITRAASQYQLFNDIVNTTSYTVSANNKRKDSTLTVQRHKMVWPNSGYYYDGIIGGKTGFTDQSGTTLVTYAKRNGMTLICVVLRSNGANVYNDTSSLLDYGFNNFNLVNVSEKDNRFSEVNTNTLQSPFSNTTDSIYIDKDSNVVIPKKGKFSDLTSAVTFGITEDSFATITYKLGDTTVGTAKLKYESNNSQKTDSKKNTTEKETVNHNTNAADNKNTQADNKSETKKKSFKLPKIVVPVIVVLLIVVILGIIINMQRRRLNRIRAMKRRRNR